MIQDADWLMSLGNAFAEQYELYSTDDEHSALLHRLFHPSSLLELGFVCSSLTYYDRRLPMDKQVSLLESLFSCGPSNVC